MLPGFAPPALTPDARLRALHAHERAWRSLAWTNEQEITLIAPFQLSGSFLVSTSTGSPRSLVVRRLGSRLHGVAPREWALQFDFDFGPDLLVDAGQDLLLLVGFQNMYVELSGCVLHAA